MGPTFLLLVFLATALSVVAGYFVLADLAQRDQVRARKRGEEFRQDAQALAGPNAPQLFRSLSELDLGPPEPAQPGAAAVEFCIVAALLVTIFLAMIEVGGAMMALGAIANAARVGARAGAVTAGTYSDITSNVQAALDGSSVGGSAQVVVTVNGTEVTDDATFKANATPGAPISVRVSVPCSSVSWLPAGTGLFLSGQQSLAEAAVCCPQG